MTTPDLSIPRERYKQIARQIASPDSPVGIDAEKTHVIILHLLLDLDARLARLEERQNAAERSGDGLTSG